MTYIIYVFEMKCKLKNLFFCFLDYGKVYWNERQKKRKKLNTLFIDDKWHRKHTLIISIFSFQQQPNSTPLQRFSKSILKFHLKWVRIYRECTKKQIQFAHVIDHFDHVAHKFSKQHTHRKYAQVIWMPFYDVILSMLNVLHNDIFPKLFRQNSSIHANTPRW